MFLGSEVLTDNALRIVLTDDFNSLFLPLRTKMDFSVFAYRVSMWAILFRRLLKLASVLGRLEIGFDECKSSFDSVLARIVPAFVLGRLEADYDDGISSSGSELFYCGDLIGEIGGV